jgi:hypothetical protein
MAVLIASGVEAKRAVELLSSSGENLRVALDKHISGGA